MNRDAALLVLVGIVVLVVLVAAGLGLAGGTRMQSSAGTPVALPDPPRDGSSGVVFDLREEKGQSLFGITLTASDYFAHVGVVVPEPCLITDDAGNESLSQAGECADLPVRGEVSGSGTTIDGERLAIVEIEISESCFEALAVGNAWPADSEACTD